MVNTLTDIDSQWDWLLHEEMYLEAVEARRQAGVAFVPEFLGDLSLRPSEISEIHQFTENCEI